MPIDAEFCAFWASRLTQSADAGSLPPSLVAQDSTCPGDTPDWLGEAGPGARSGRGGDGDLGGAVFVGMWELQMDR